MIAAWATLWAILALLAIMAHALIWSRRESAWRHVAVPLVVVGAVVLAVGLARTIGEPRPWRLAAKPPPRAEVLGFRIDEDRAIYVMLNRKGAPPLLLELPYSARRAQQLEDAERQRRKGRQGRIVMRYDENAVRDQLMFHPPPVPASPPKRAERFHP